MDLFDDIWPGDKMPELIERYGGAIRGKMEDMEAVDWSDSELERCLGRCVSGEKLIIIAKAMR